LHGTWFTALEEVDANVFDLRDVRTAFWAKAVAFIEAMDAIVKRN
jgi:hypothetical protein